MLRFSKFFHLLGSELLSNKFIINTFSALTVGWVAGRASGL